MTSAAIVYGLLFSHVRTCARIRHLEQVTNLHDSAHVCKSTIGRVHFDLLVNIVSVIAVMRCAGDGRGAGLIELQVSKDKRKQIGK